MGGGPLRVALLIAVLPALLVGVDSYATVTTPQECADGEHSGVSNGDSPSRIAVCVGAGGRVIAYAGGDAMGPCGTVIAGDQTVISSAGRARDPNLCWGPEDPAYDGPGRLFREPVIGGGGVVASISKSASTAGVEVLRRGGNAVDAAAATIFAVGVARPENCGIGGGGLLLYRRNDGHSAVLDFIPTAPAAMQPDSLTGNGVNKFAVGHRIVGVPGTVAGMEAALERYGTIDLSEAIAPAERLAREGFAVSEYLSDNYLSPETDPVFGQPVFRAGESRLRANPEAARTYLRDGVIAPSPGSVLELGDYADSLRLIAQGGADAFYEGPIGQAIARDMDQSRLSPLPGDQGLMTAADLAGYEPVWRTPLSGTYRGREILGTPPPTVGGITTIEALNVLEGYDLPASGGGSADRLHLLAEAQKLAWADRTEYIADPAFRSIPTAQLISKEYAVARRGLIDIERAQSYPPGLGPATQPEAAAGSHTTHVSVIDSDGNAVAVTCTLGDFFGAATVAPGTGFLLNDQLGFSAPGSANEAEGGKRARSSMSPTIVVENGAPILVTGGGGSERIPFGVLLTVLNVVDHGLDPARAQDAPRIDERTCCEMSIEERRIPDPELAELRRRGHSLVPAGEYGGVPWLNSAGIDPGGFDRLAASDPREEDGAAAE